MAQERIRAQVDAHWRNFDALVDAQSGGNEAIIRALDVFEGARGAFTAEQAAAHMLSGQQQQEAGWAMPMPIPRGAVNTGATEDEARRAYFRAEEALTLAREQLGRNEETLALMSEEVDHARACIGSCYDTEDVASRQDRQDLRARASRQVLDRGESGCAMSPVEMARAMAGLLRMHQSELEMQENIVFGLGYETPVETVTAYRETLRLRPFMDDRFRSEVQEVRELSEELECPRTGV
ncbi:unnamed protein product [Scytosiphon promiscuus]